MLPPGEVAMYIRSNDEAHYELAGSKLAADTMVDRVTHLGLSVLGILWSLGKTTKTQGIRSHSQRSYNSHV